MSKNEILEELSKLARSEREEIRAKLDELDGSAQTEAFDEGELTEREKRIIEERLDDYEKHPRAGAAWEEVEARIRTKLRAQ